LFVLLALCQLLPIRLLENCLVDERQRVPVFLSSLLADGLFRFQCLVSKRI